MARRRSPPKLNGNDPAWFDLSAEEMGGAVQRLVRDYRTAQSSRRAAYIRNLEAYEGRALGGYSAHAYCEGPDDPFLLFEGERLRLIRSAVSTAVANIYAPQKPKPQFQTLGATWAMRRKAAKLDKICEGIINQRQRRWINVWALMIDAGVDACLQGVAAIFVTGNRAQGRIEHDLIPLPDIFADPVEGRQPRNLFMRRPMDVEQVVAMAEEAGVKDSKVIQAIRNAPPYEWIGASKVLRARTTKVIQVEYAWKLPDGEDRPGKWCISTGGVTIDSGDWTAPSFPFVFLQWEPHRDGFWASGIADEGLRQARECDDLDLRLTTRERVASGNKGFYVRESVKPDDLSQNDPITWIAVEPGVNYPTVQSVPPFNPMELDYLRTKIQAFWDAIGISQVSAAARREQGVSSGVAMRTLNDTKAGRQLVKAQRYEQAFVDLAHQYIWRLRELAEENKGLLVRWSGKSLIREIKWSDADVEDDAFSITVAPASALPHDPAGRQEMVQDLYRGGLISQETAKQLMGWPDFDAELEVENAETEYVDMLIERYLDADVEEWTAADYQAPEGFILNKPGAIRRFASAWFRARIDQAMLPEASERAKANFNIDLLVRWIREMDSLMQPPAPPPGAVAPPGPGGLPMPPGAAGPGALPPVPPMPPAPAPIPGGIPVAA
jgi:hypothetical protein